MENPASYKIKRGVSHMHENMGLVFFALQNHRVELKFDINGFSSIFFLLYFYFSGLSGRKKRGTGNPKLLPLILHIARNSSSFCYVF